MYVAVRSIKFNSSQCNRSPRKREREKERKKTKD